MDQSWHSGSKLQKNLLDFHQACASFPKDRVAEAQKHHVSTMDTLRGVLQRDGVALRFEYTGSSYEGIKVPSTDVEFDVMVVLSGGNYISDEEIRPCFSKLHCDSNAEPLSKIRQPYSEYLDPNAAAEYFFGKLQKAINQHKHLEEKITLRRHGPAVQMDVFRERRGWDLFYSVDMVPSFHIPGGWLFSSEKYYIAKPFKDEDVGSEHSSLAWRKSFSLKEKSLLQTIDSGNQCRKQCMRIFKVLRDNEVGLYHLNSYILKTAVLSMTRDLNLDWGQSKLGQRFIDLLKYLCRALEKNNLPHYFEPKFNLVGRLSPIHRENMMCRLRELVRSEQYFCEALTNAQYEKTGSVTRYEETEEDSSSLLWNFSKLVLSGVAVGVVAVAALMGKR